jgi:VWFA-related protein
VTINGQKVAVATHIARILVAALSLTSIGARQAPVASPPQQRPTFRAGIDLVQIDVVVVDAEGQPVRGLTRNDFQIADRGRFQRITAFEEIAHERLAPPLLPPTLSLDVADNSTARSDRLIVLILDDLHFRGRTGEVKDMARRVVEELGPKASLALVTTSGTFGIEPTEDRALILTELERFIDKYDPEGRRTRATSALSLRSRDRPRMGTASAASRPSTIPLSCRSPRRKSGISV